MSHNVATSSDADIVIAPKISELEAKSFQEAPEGVGTERRKRWNMLLETRIKLKCSKGASSLRKG
jgi:hypothetical protein